MREDYFGQINKNTKSQEVFMLFNFFYLDSESPLVVADVKVDSNQFKSGVLSTGSTGETLLSPFFDIRCEAPSLFCVKRWQPQVSIRKWMLRNKLNVKENTAFTKKLFLATNCLSSRGFLRGESFELRGLFTNEVFSNCFPKAHIKNVVNIL